MKKFSKLVSTAGIGAALLFSSSAQAHRAVPANAANQTMYNLYRSHCGNGLSWVCVNGNIRLDSTPAGDHSWATYYAWQEATVFSSRWCDVYMRYDTHVGAFVQWYQTETCH